MYPRACRGWRPPCLAQTWGKGHEGGVALELIQEIGVEAAWVLELGGVPVRRYKQRDQEGAMGGDMQRLPTNLARLPFIYPRPHLEARGKVDLISCSQGLISVDLG